MSTGTVRECTEALHDLIRSANYEADRAWARGLRGASAAGERISKQLDAMRTLLIQEGDIELDQGWAYVDAGRLSLANLALHIDHYPILRRAHHAHA
jgi:hypothetical protein